MPAEDLWLKLISGGGTLALALAVFVLQRDMAKALTSIKEMLAILVDRKDRKKPLDTGSID